MAQAPQRPDPATLDRPGLADVHGVLALSMGVVTVVLAVLCMGRRQEELFPLMAFLGVVGTTWTAAFGVLTRGTPRGRMAAWMGLAMVPLAIFLGFATLCLA